jgi:hypothetical protein
MQRHTYMHILELFEYSFPCILGEILIFANFYLSYLKTMKSSALIAMTEFRFFVTVD